MGKIRLVLVDDHQVLRVGLRALFERQADIEVLGEASTVSEAISLARQFIPDIIVLDLTVPGGGGMSVLKTLKAEKLPIRPLVLTMHDDPAYARAALAAGASGYVVKTVSEQDLLTAVRAVARGQIFVDLDEPLRTASVFGLTGPSGSRGGPGAVAKLSEREQQILQLLGQGHSNLAIAEKLDLSPKTVATYKARIGEKLGLKSTADFVRFATDNGLLGQDRPSS